MKITSRGNFEYFCFYLSRGDLMEGDDCELRDVDENIVEECFSIHKVYVVVVVVVVA